MLKKDFKEATGGRAADPERVQPIRTKEAMTASQVRVLSTVRPQIVGLIKKSKYFSSDLLGFLFPFRIFHL
jgi:hypothetical protein